MKKKINSRLIAIAVLAVVATALSITMLYYGLFQRQVQSDLQMCAEALRDTGIFRKENQQTILANYANSQSRQTLIPDLRITWVDSDGTVLYDKDMNAAQMENHADRPEIRDAFENGTGAIVRKSDTMNMSTFYYAIRLEDGTALRVSTEARSMVSVFVAIAPAIALILAVIIVVCVFLAHLLTKQLLHPIEKMAQNLEDSSAGTEYKELIPFMNTIRMQHENILAAAKSRQDFTANVSHELKTPLTAISGYAELIENHMVDASQEEHIAQEIRRNADRLVTLINDIIRLSELDHSQDQQGFEQLDLYAVASECTEALAMNAQKRNISLTLTGSTCMVRANREMMRELMDNLCQNAIRYNNEGGYVHVTIGEINDKPTLIVQDNGIGIPKNQQERVFERFYRVDKSRSRETGGTGLGLAIVKHIVELHDAKLFLDSEVGKGTTIRVEF